MVLFQDGDNDEIGASIATIIAMPAPDGEKGPCILAEDAPEISQVTQPIVEMKGHPVSQIKCRLN